MRTTIFPAKFDQLDAIREFASQAARDAGMDDSSIYAVELSTDEACTNVIEHAYEGLDGGEIECTCDVDEKDFIIIVHDHGKSFDPSSIALPDLDADVESRPVGGLGVFLMKKLMDEVRFEPLGEAGNVLTMKKRLNSSIQKGKPAKPASIWKQVTLLGEEILRASSITARHDLIVARCANILNGQVSLWLEEGVYKLPGTSQAAIYPSNPGSPLMRKAVSTGRISSADKQKTSVAVPLKNGDVVLGTLQVDRSEAPFAKKDMELLEGLAGHISLALITSHRVAVEQWRIEQLMLVRRVSAQIANVFDMGELTRRVTKLIQRTFHYYYVAIFTGEQDGKNLKFWSSAGPEKGKGKRVHARLGEGLIGSVATSGEEAVINDVRSDPRFKYITSLPETESEAVLPLKFEGRILGVLDVQADHLDGFHPNDLLVLRALADTIALAINGVLLYSELQRRIDHLAMVAEVSEKITTTLELDQVLENVADLIQKNLDYPYVHLFTVHLNRRQIIYEAGSGKRNLAYKGYVIGLDDPGGMIPWVARTGQALLANDVRTEPKYLPSPFPPEDTRAEMTIPLVFNERVVGVMDLQSNRANVFTDDDRFLCEALAHNVAAAIHNAILFSTERWRRQVADSFQEVAGLISAETSLDDVLDSILRELDRNLPCEVAAIWLLEGEELYLAHVHGADMVELENAARRWPESYNFLAEALSTEKPVIRKPDDPIGPTGTAMGFSADYSSIAAGLRTGSHPLGVLTLAHHTSGRYGHEAQEIVATFANYAAVAIENTRLYDQAQEQAYASAALLQVAQAVAKSNDLDETISSVVRITPILVGVKACGIYLLEVDHFHPTHAYGFSDAAESLLWNRDFQPGDFPLLDLVEQEPQLTVGLLPTEMSESWLDPVIANTEQETLYALQNGDHLLIGFPLLVKNDLYGVMLVEETSESRRFRQKRVEIITSIAQQVSLSIQNEHLQEEMVSRERLEHEIQLARKIQKTFLPEKLPELEGWSLAATWVTARQVGGDFYDVFELPGGKVGLFIADVSDKGIPAALFMALTRTLVRAVVFDTPSPALALKRVNTLIIPDNQQGMFVTAVYGVLTLKSGEFIFANAGHNPPLWSCGKTRTLEALRRTGPALGIIEDVQLEDNRIFINPDDFLLLYTDGMTEAFSPEDEIYGDERFQRSLAEGKDGSARAILDHLEASVRKFMGSLPPGDDLTMLGIKRMG